MTSNFQKLAKAVYDLDSIEEISDEDKFTLVGCYTEQLIKNVELKNKLSELQEESKRVEAQLWI